MYGDPLGSQQSHPVPQELRCYGAVSSIEFILDAVDPGRMCSAAYRPTENGAQLRTRVADESPLEDAELTEEQAHAYIQRIIDAGIFEWNRIYRPAQGTFVLRSDNWRLSIEFVADEAGKAPKPFVVEGENVFPENFEQIVNYLLGDELL